ncbi:MAG TPA: dienelactone hydrolase family protein [Acidimicrobiales bacterium]|nr:dienelactone hydrolase family protein [Acidimicrobiales bacterium]
MGEIIEYASNGSHAQGYLASSDQGGPGVIVIQEYWGLIDQITRTCDRFAAEGFTALAPDLYHGKKVPLSEPDEAAKEMMALSMDVTAKELSGTVDELLRRTGRDRVGVIGFCMGGGLALVLGTQRPDAVAAVVTAYGLIPWPDAAPDFSKLNARVLGHFGDQDDFFTPEKARELESQLKQLGKDVTFYIYEGAGHAFFNEDRPEAYRPEAAQLLWDRTVAFFRETLS